MNAKTLLIIDDAAIIRAKIKEAASSAGWTVAAEAANGKEGVDRYVECRPAVVTVDMVMPEYDGIYALREILALNPDAKVVVVSAVEQKAILKEAFQIGAADFIVKPFDRAMLIKTLEQYAPAEELAVS
jgi:two-component system chemotaxis response regulator CheY